MHMINNTDTYVMVLLWTRLRTRPKCSRRPLLHQRTMRRQFMRSRAILSMRNKHHALQLQCMRIGTIMFLTLAPSLHRETYLRLLHPNRPL
jgi:hypothetical protein